MIFQSGLTLINIFLLVSSDLSNYTPKHSVEFNAWQEHKLDESAQRGEDTSQSTEEVMVNKKKDHIQSCGVKWVEMCLFM